MNSTSMECQVLMLMLSVFIISVMSNTASVSPWYPDQHSDPNFYKCGDVFLSKNHDCKCGKDNWNWFKTKEEKYCCVQPGSQCRNNSKGVVCKSGRLLPWQVPCHGDNCAHSPKKAICNTKTDNDSHKRNNTNSLQVSSIGTNTNTLQDSPMRTNTNIDDDSHKRTNTNTLQGSPMRTNTNIDSESHKRTNTNIDSDSHKRTNTNTVQDSHNRTECLNNKDELLLYTSIIVLGVCGVSGGLIVIVTVIICFKVIILHRKKHNIQFEKLLVFSVKNFHFNPSLRSFDIFPFLAVNSSDKQRDVLRVIAREEEKFHRNDELQTMLWLKNSYSKCEISVMMEFLSPSLLKRKFPVLGVFQKTIESYKRLWSVLRVTREILIVYVNLTKDILISCALLAAIGGPLTLIYFPTAFPSVVVIMFLLSVLLPSAVASLQLARDQPDVIYGDNFYKQPRWRQNLGRLGIVLLTPIIPVFLIEADDSHQRKLQYVQEKKYRDIKDIREKAEKIQRRYVIFVRTHLAMQVIFQMTLQTVLLLLSRTSSPTVSGLRTVCGNSTSW